MNGKTKALTIIAAAVAVCMLVYSPLTQATQTQVSLGDDLEMAEIEQYKPKRFPIRPRARFAVWFLKNAEPTEIEGEVVALLQRKLILSTDDERIRVNMPIQWIVDEQVLTLKELFENYLEGKSVTVKVLEANMIDKEGLRIYILVGYELVTDSGSRATACLKVNIAD
jgi:hypothetical protein